MSELTKEYRIAQLLARKIAGELSSEEEKELMEWEKESSISSEVYRKVLDPENKSKRDKYIHNIDTESSWQKLKEQIPSKKRHSKNLFWWSGAAAAVIIISLMNVFLREQTPEGNDNLSITEIHAGSPKAILITAEGKQFNLTKQDSSGTLQLGYGFTTHGNGDIIEYSTHSDPIKVQMTQKHIIKVPKGGEYELILPDGTHVWINSDSQLSFPVQFDSTKREVSLTGEAYFSVEKDEKKPFIVKVDEDIEIKVLGTQFNVQAYQDENTVETTLCEGSVNVSDGKHNITLIPSYQAIYSKMTRDLTTHKVNTRLYTSWRKGLFVFENKPLEEIMNTLARWYDIQVFYANQSVKTYHFTGDLERYGDFRKTLRMIEKATSIRFIVNGKNIMIEETQN